MKSNIIAPFEVFKDRIFVFWYYRVIFSIRDVIGPNSQFSKDVCNIIPAYFAIKERSISVSACVKTDALVDIIIGIGITTEVDVDPVSY